MKTKLNSFINTVNYCFTLSWKASKKYTILKFFLKIVSVLIPIILSYTIKQIIAILIQSQTHTNNLYLYVFVMAFTLIISTIISKINEYITKIHTDILINRLDQNIITKSLSADISLFDSKEYFDVFESVQRDTYTVINSFWSIVDFVVYSISLIINFMIFYNFNKFFSVVLILVAIPSAWFEQKRAKKLYFWSIDSIDNERKLGYLFSIAISKIYVFQNKLYNLKKYLIEKYNNIFSHYLKEKTTIIRNQTKTSIFLSILPDIIIMLILIFIISEILKGKKDISDFSFYYSISRQLSMNIVLYISSILNIYENQLKIQNIKNFDIITKSKILNGNIKINNKDSIKIEFKDVNFKYPKTTKNILENINFIINKKEKVALIGVNGAGKTTIIKLLLRLYDVVDGKILINDINIKKYDIHNLRNHFSCLFQDFINYSFTFKENITISNWEEEIDNLKMEKALKHSGMDKIINTYSNHINTFVNRNFHTTGVELSGGSSQKLALARAFYKESKVLILDEPSAALDPKSESDLFKKLEKLSKDKTVIFTSHRLSNTYLADKIIVIDNATIIEIGSHEELMRNEVSKYRELYNMQSSRYKN